ncbi:Lipopolysaccharide-induced tumor necrosis factor-alpha factor -like protein [Halotydeus destructor]|nr:Lipopolysaccharide-induced tumor necrosis factor-alpha factor -like protein [Halotydeus destructor]
MSQPSKDNITFGQQPPPYGPVVGQPQAQGYSQQYGAGMQAPMAGPPPGNTVIVTSAQGPYPYPTSCSNCGSQVVTEVTPVTGAVTWISAFVISAIGGSLCCLCYIPFFVDSCKDAEHRCPNCKMYLGTHKRMCA